MKSGVVFIGGELDGKTAVLDGYRLHEYRHAVLPEVTRFSMEPAGPSSQSSLKIERYHAMEFHVERPYFLMVLDGMAPEEVFLRILDYYVEHAEAMSECHANR